MLYVAWQYTASTVLTYECSQKLDIDLRCLKLSENVTWTYMVLQNLKLQISSWNPVICIFCFFVCTHTNAGGSLIFWDLSAHPGCQSRTIHLRCKATERIWQCDPVKIVLQHVWQYGNQVYINVVWDENCWICSSWCHVARHFPLESMFLFILQVNGE